MVQIPDLILFLYDSYRKFFRTEVVSNREHGARSDVSTQAFDSTFQEDRTQQSDGNTRKEMGTSTVSNHSESGDIRLKSR